MTNGEKYKTKAERTDAMLKFCKEHECSKCPASSEHSIGCAFSWLELEAEEEKPLQCPFCGGETHKNLGHLRVDQIHYWVDCVSTKCMYRSAHFLTEAEATAAHNRVVRAVMEAKESEVKE